MIVAIGERPYGPEEIAGALDVDVAGSLAWDTRGAHALLEGRASRALRRTPLLRSARTLLNRLTPTCALAEVQR